MGHREQNTSEYLPHPLLKQINGFEASIDQILEPGDILYIPPNTPHCGVAIQPCLTYSIGFRAPSKHNLMEQLLLDLLEQEETDSERYQDKNPSHLLNTSYSINEFDPTNIDQSLPANTLGWSKNLLDNLSDEQIIGAFGKLVTKPKHDLFEESELTLKQISEHLKKVLNKTPIKTDTLNETPRTTVQLHPDTRATYYPFDKKLLLFVNGERFTIENCFLNLIQNLINHRSITHLCLKNTSQDIDFINTIAILVKQGWLNLN